MLFRSRMYVDTEGKQLVADGSDFIVVVAEVTDDSGNVRRLAKENIVFTVEGEGRIIGDASINANPRTVEFGSAPVLIRSTRKPGKIKVKAHVQFEGTNAPVATEIELESIPSELPFCYTEEETDAQSAGAGLAGSPVRTERMAGKVVLTEEERQKVLMEVERQQTEFGTEKYDYLRLYHGSQGDSLETPSGVFHDQQSVVYSAGSVDDESSGAGGRLKPHGLSRIYEDLFLLLRGSCDASDRKDIRL